MECQKLGWTLSKYLAGRPVGVEWGVCWTRELEFHWKWWAEH